MYLGYKQIFWGLLLASFHINVGPLVIIRPFIAWLIVCLGVHQLVQNCTEPTANELFFKARFFAISITVIALLGEIISYLGKNEIWLQFLPVIFIVLELLQTYYLLEGSYQLLPDYKHQCRKLSVYLIFYIIYTVFLCIAITFALSSLSIILQFTELILRIWLLTQMHKLMKRYETNQ